MKQKKATKPERSGSAGSSGGGAPNKGGRPPRFTRDEVAEALRLSGGLQTQAARRLGCSADAVADYLRRWPDLRDVLEQAEDMMLDRSEFRLWEAIERGEAWAIKFHLETKGRRRGYGKHVDVDAKVAATPVLNITLEQAPA